MSQNNCTGISISPKDYIDFMTRSERVSLPSDNLGKRKIIHRMFHDSCMMVEDPKGNYFVGEMNWTNSTGYSMTVNGKERQFLYADLKGLFKPRLA